MKFARGFKESLAREDFPEHWVQHAIPYGKLKKCLKQVQRELLELGLDSETLKSLIEPSTAPAIALQYNLNTTSGSNVVRPKLTVLIRLKDGEVVDASLTPTTRRFFERLAAELPGSRKISGVASPDAESSRRADLSKSSVAGQSPESLRDADTVAASSLGGGSSAGRIETIEVPLVSDGQFFDLLQNDVQQLDSIQADEEKAMAGEITALGKEVARATKPGRFSKTDMAVWRDIFELYLDAQIFFNNSERAHGGRPSTAALTQLQWFQNEVEKRQLPAQFRIRESRQALSRFFTLNADLLKNLKFQELNQLAIGKILKKFDKRTALGASQSFRSSIGSYNLVTGALAKDMCGQMSQELVSVVPQLNDYLCPVCFAIAYRPVRLSCQHVFCIRCIIKIQRRKAKSCPLCRADVVMDASDGNLDTQLESYLRKYFPDEVKEKQRANDMERGIEDFGPDYKPSECTVM